MRRPNRGGRVLESLAPLLIGIVIMAPVGCSSSAKFSVSNLLFDGVKHPDSLRAEAHRDSLEAARIVALAMDGDQQVIPAGNQDLITKHPPYEDGDCTVCHESGDPKSFSGTAALVDPIRVLCLDCHDDLSHEELQEEYAWVHGPVAAGACNGCHNPHQSTFENLLLADGARDLCLRCHGEAAVNASPSHTDVTGADCTSCHGAHGWSSRGTVPGDPGKGE
jgi:predicted CXXCH cytochrome family protein